MRIILLAAAAAALLTGGCDRQKAAQSQAKETAAPAAQSGGAGLDRSQVGKPLPELTVKDSDGEDVTLASLTGKPLLINLWATWCAPCIKELPTLARLSEQSGAVQVIALSQDMQPQANVAAFLDERKIGLEAYLDAEMGMSSALGVQILPTTVLYGSDGKEIWRYTGDLDWAGPKASELLREAR